MDEHDMMDGRITDHDYEAPAGKPWGLCIHCNMARASHAGGPVYVSDAPRAKHENEKEKSDGE